MHDGIRMRCREEDVPWKGSCCRVALVPPIGISREKRDITPADG